MTHVKCHNTETGKTEIIASFDRPTDHDGPGEMLANLVEQDHSTDHVYYLSDKD